MPQVIRDRLLEFEQRREQYLAQQLELVHQLHKVSDAERAQLREQLREQRQAWLEEAKKIREQARARLQEMKKELSNHSEVIEAAREQARDAKCGNKFETKCGSAGARTSASTVDGAGRTQVHAPARGPGLRLGF